MVEIPADCLFDSLLELEAWLPAELFLELGAVDGVSCVVAKTVCHIGDQAFRVPFRITEDAVHSLDHDLDQVDVLPFVEASYIIGLGYPAFVEDQVDRPCMVLDVEPVTHVLALAIDRKRLAVTDVVDEQRDEFLRELVRTVVVRAVGHDGRHAVGVVIGSDKMV